MTTIRLHDVSKHFTGDPPAPGGNRSPSPLNLSFSPRSYSSASRASEPARPQALNHVNLEIRSGETMGVLGPSGCGKSTLLKVIAGLIPVDSGSIEYDGQNMADILPGDRRLGVVFQDYALYPHMQSIGNIGFFFRVHHRPEEIPERVREVSKIMGVGFDQLLSRRPPTLSGGERQRVAVARCIAREPNVFLFDEPLSNLDAKLRVQTRYELKKLLDRFRVTGLYVTHDQSEAIALCDRLAIMRDGHIEQVGSYTRLIDQPVNTFVAGFLGTPPINLFPGYWTEAGWQGSQFAWPLPPELRQSTQHSGTLGVRPEHIIIDPAQPLKGIVTLVEPLVSERAALIYIDCDGATCVARISSNMPFSAAQIGESVNFGFATEGIILFDGITSRRI